MKIIVYYKNYSLYKNIDIHEVNVWKYKYIISLRLIDK